MTQGIYRLGLQNKQNGFAQGRREDQYRRKKSGNGDETTVTKHMCVYVCLCVVISFILDAGLHLSVYLRSPPAGVGHIGGRPDQHTRVFLFFFLLKTLVLTPSCVTPVVEGQPTTREEDGTTTHTHTLLRRYMRV